MSTVAKEIGRGALWTFGAEALAVPAGLLIARLLSTSLGPSGYGRYGIAASVVVAAEWLIAAAYTRVSVQLLSESRAGRAMEASVIRHYLFTGLGVLLLFMLSADWIGSWLHAPDLARDLRWLAIDVPLFALSQAQRSILAGRGDYTGRATAIVIRWVSRVAGTALLLAFGFGILAALWAWPIASLAEVACLHKLPLRSLWSGQGTPFSMWREGWSPFLFGAGQRSMERVDLFFLQAFGAAADTIGLYVAAQNLAILPGLFAASFTPVLIGTLTRERVLGREQASRQAAALSFKATLYMLPIAAVFATCGDDVSALAFGPKFRAAGMVTGWLVTGAIGMALAAAAASILSSQGRQKLTAYLSLPAAASATLLQLVVVPRFGAQGAAIVSAAVGMTSGLIAMSVVYRVWRQRFPMAMLFRAAVATLVILPVARFPAVEVMPWFVRSVLFVLTAAGMLMLCGERRIFDV